jgi:hypothetical protein
MDLMTYMLAQKGGGGGESDLPVVTPADDGKILGVVSGAWSPANPDTVIDLPMTLQVGTQESPVYLSELDEGLYAINGKYYILRNSEPLETDYNIIALVSKEEGLDRAKVKVITADNVTDYDIKENGSSIAVYTNKIVTEKYLSDNHYVIETDLAGYMPKISNPDVGRVTISNSNGNVQESDYTILDSDNRGISGVLTGYMFNDGEEPPVYPMAYWDSVNCTVHTTEFDKDHVVTGYSESWSDGPGHLVMTGEENLDLVSTGINISDIEDLLTSAIKTPNSFHGTNIIIGSGQSNKVAMSNVSLNDLATKSFVGSIPQDSSATTIIDYIDEVTTPIKPIPNTPASIATFSGAAALPMPSLTVGIEATQDLHGYDKPWVGGAGKNKLENTATTTSRNGLDFTVYPDGSVLVNGTATASTELVLNTNAVPTEGNYIISGCPEGGTSTTYWINYKVTINGVSNWMQEYGNGRTENNATIQNVGIYIFNGAVINNIMFYPMIRLASVQDDTFAPYSNICPIIGHTEANVVVSPTTDAEDGTTYNIQFKDGSNPLTVYGGTLDVVSGELVVTHIIIKANTLNWYYLQNTFYSGSVGISADGSTDINSDFVCSFAKSVNKEWNQLSNNECTLRKNLYSQGYYSLCVKNTEYTNATDFKNSLDSTSEITFPIATPLTIQLTPTAVKSLLGTNNLWADSGKVISGEYRASRYQDIYTYGALPSVMSSDNGKLLQVVNGEWQAVDLDANSTSY